LRCLSIIGSFPLLPRTVREKDIELELGIDNAYTVSEEGLKPWPSAQGHSSPSVKLNLHLASCRFGGDSAKDFHPSIRRFVNALKKLGSRPEYERNEDGPNFVFWFDVSSPMNLAYYELGTGNHGQEIVVSLFCRQVDPIIVENVRRLDGALYGFIERCGVTRF